MYSAVGDSITFELAATAGSDCGFRDCGFCRFGCNGLPTSGISFGSFTPSTHHENPTTARKEQRLLQAHLYQNSHENKRRKEQKSHGGKNQFQRNNKNISGGNEKKTMGGNDPYIKHLESLDNVTTEKKNTHTHTHTQIDVFGLARSRKTQKENHVPIFFYENEELKFRIFPKNPFSEFVPPNSLEKSWAQLDPAIKPFGLNGFRGVDGGWCTRILNSISSSELCPGVNS